jgi:cell division protein FtsZ
LQSDLRESKELSDCERGFGLPKILVIGCGGAGNNAVSGLSKMGLKGARIVAINTDSQQLKTAQADELMLIGQKITKGMGAGGNPEVGRKAAELAATELEGILKGADLVFVIAGLGGGTGTGSAPVVARLARERGAIVVAMLTTPFHLERARVFLAEEGLDAVRRYADTSIVLDNNRLLDCASHLPVQNAFSMVNRIMAEIVEGICDTLTSPSLINLDYADVCTIMRSGGASFMFVGEGKLRSSPEKIVRNALKNPLLDVDYRGAGACLLHMTGGPDMTMREAAAIAGALTQELDPKANVIWGARIRPDFEGKVRLMAIITGVKSSQILSPSESPEARLDYQNGRERKIDKNYAKIDMIK